MMMRMLEAGGIPPLTDHIRRADDDNPTGYYEFERAKKLRDGDTAWLEEASGKAVKTISALLEHLPDGYRYRVVFMRRSMAEILASQKKMLVNRGEDPDKIDDGEMARLFEGHLKKTVDWLTGRPNFDVLFVDYNDMLADPGPQIVAVNGFLGGGLDIERMAAVVDPDLYRQRARKG